MASILKKNSSVDLEPYNNYMARMVEYYNSYVAHIKKIVTLLNSTVMKKDIWTDDTAKEYAYWFFDEKGTCDGSDRLNKGTLEVEKLIKITCINPVKAVVKQSQDALTFGYIKKAYNSKQSVFTFTGVKKYHKEQYAKIRLKRPVKEKVAIQANAINSMNTNINKELNALKSLLTDKIQPFVKNNIIDSTTIMITGFNAAVLNKSIKESVAHIDKFIETNKKYVDKVTAAINASQEELKQTLSSDTAVEQ